jgi:hypothetical protein
MIETATAYGLTARAAVHAGEVELRVTRCGGARSMPQHAIRLWAAICRPGEFQLRGLDGCRTLAALVR